MKTITLLISLFICSMSLGEELTASQRVVVKKYEQELMELVKDKNIPAKNLYYIYLIVARDFHLENIDDYYVTYLTKAKNLKVKEDKSEAYWRLIDFHRTNGSIVEAKKFFTEWESLGQSTNEVMSQAFKILKLSLFDSSKSSITKSQKEALEKGPFSYMYKMSNLDELIKSKQYAKALSLINPKNLEDEMISNVIRYDLLGSLTLGKGHKKLLCESTYKKYPDSLSYSIKICKSLMEFRENGQVSLTTLKETKEILDKKIYKNEQFLYSALSDLK